jgi:hypothetical protein
MRFARTLRPAAAVLGLVAAASPAVALDEIPEYHVTRMGELLEEVFPDVQYPFSTSRGMNENGDLVGYASVSDSQIQAWVYTVEHGVVALPLVPAFTSNVALDVSDRDANGEIAIVGGGVPSIYWDLTIGVAALWRFSTVTGAVLETRVIGILPGFGESLALAVDNAGTVVGYSGHIGPWAPMKYDVATDTLETFDFPARPVDINNAGQVIGGRYRGDLEGNYVALGIPPGCTSLSLGGLNDAGWVTGRAGRPFTDGAGHFMVSIVRFTDEGWHVMNAYSHLDNGSDINNHGDVVGDIGVSSAVRGALYIDALNELHLLEDLMAPGFANEVFPVYSHSINDNGQIASYSGDAVLLTPLGEMIVPGDVNGDVQVDLDDHCAWLADPIDLNGDGVVDGADEQWLIDRLAVFGHFVQDCNDNGSSDHCDILDGVSADCDGDDVPDECQADCSGDGVPDTCEPDCNGNGIADPCDIAELTSQDCNGNGIPDECDGGGVSEFTHVFDPPVNLIAGEPFLADLLVTEAGTIEDVDFTIDIDYRIGYLTVLLSHGDTTITLIDRPGHPEVVQGNGQLGYDIILDDEGTGGPIEEEGNFGSPFEPITSPPSYTPDDPLGTFDGMPMNGVWTVHIITTPATHPVHEFNEWGLIITRAAVPVDPCDPADVDGNGVVNVADLVALILAWGPCVPSEPCPADVDGSGEVDVNDLVLVILNWS